MLSLKGFTRSLLALAFAIVLTGFALALAGCGAAKEATPNSSFGLSGAPPLAQQGATAECNKIPNNSFGLAGVLSSFWNGTAFVDYLARVRLTSVPADFYTSDTKYISIMRWQTSGPMGPKSYISAPASVVFVLRQNNQYLNSSSPVHQISKAVINSMIATYNLGAQGITLENFLSNVILILNIGMTEQVFDFNYYDSTVGPAPQSTASALIAPYTADPYAYRSSHPNPLLYELHPNNGMAAGLSQAEYVAATNIFCQGFLN